MDDKIKQAHIEAFEYAEASLALSGMNPKGDPFYESLKARIISGEITDEEAEAETAKYFQDSGKNFIGPPSPADPEDVYYQYPDAPR